MVIPIPIEDRWDLEQLLTDRVQKPAAKTKGVKKPRAKPKAKAKVLSSGGEKPRASEQKHLLPWRSFVQDTFGQWKEAASKEGGKCRSFKECLLHCKPLWADKRAEYLKKVRGVAPESL